MNYPKHHQPLTIIYHHEASFTIPFTIINHHHEPFLPTSSYAHQPHNGNGSSSLLIPGLGARLRTPGGVGHGAAQGAGEQHMC